MTKFYLTTPLYYANSRPHVGSAYTTLVCDAVARFRRMLGEDVAFFTGTDEHGENIERAAAAQGITPAELVERNRAVFLDLWKHLGISYTHFTRTTEPAHVRTVQTLLRRARDRGYVYKGEYQGRYCVFDNLYVSDSTDPVNCPTCGRPAELMAEENYFFKLSAFEDRLLDLYRKHPEFVQPDFRRNEVISFVSTGLKDISISRRAIHWGVPWPDDPEHVFYVWYDALSGYLTGVGFAEGDTPGSQFARYWPADVHMIGKEIIRFHAVYWPAFLMAAEMPLPRTIFAHGWLLFEQQKMSKSKGNVAHCEPIVKVTGADALRYYLLRDVVFGQDGNFSREALLTRYNSDLANDLGNLVSRTLTMLERYCQGIVPDSAANGELEAELELLAGETVTRFREAFGQLAFSRALEAVWVLVARVNQYLVETAPWVLAEDPAQRDRLASVLYAAAESLRVLAALLAPVLPEAAAKIWRQLGQEGSPENCRIDLLAWGGLRPGTRVARAEAVFPRLDKHQAVERIETMENEIRPPASAPAQPAASAGPASSAAPAPAATQPAAGPAPRISIEEFAKVDMRVGQVKTAERVAGTDRLMRLVVDIGAEERQVVAGIAGMYQPEQLVGRKVVIVANLEPRKLRGLESNGMIVAATRPDGGPVLCSFTEDVPPGARLK
ncbi:MAG TPA: methionine--tRNA ligase [Candidatus Acidoferrales bacterium]|nr:methionine--tRNA ligase [Candidatus Acidoferrales bacterium]